MTDWGRNCAFDGARMAGYGTSVTRVPGASSELTNCPSPGSNRTRVSRRTRVSMTGSAGCSVCNVVSAIRRRSGRPGGRPGPASSAAARSARRWSGARTAWACQPTSTNPSRISRTAFAVANGSTSSESCQKRSIVSAAASFARQRASRTAWGYIGAPRPRAASTICSRPLVPDQGAELCARGIAGGRPSAEVGIEPESDFHRKPSEICDCWKNR